MTKLLSLLVGLLLGTPAFAAQVLIVADEFPAMNILAARLQAEEHLESQIVAQTNLPASLTPFAAVLVYIHKDLREEAAGAFIAYAKAGGRLIALHHSISSGKRKNKEWFPFLGVSLPTGDVTAGGYQWTEGVTLSLVNLAPAHFITTNKLAYPERIAWTNAPAVPGGDALPGFTLPHTEVYLNHVLTGPRTLLLGLRYTDAKTGREWCQTHAGWIKPAGRGWVVYLMAGHSALDFENPLYSRLVANAVVFPE